MFLKRTPWENVTVWLRNSKQYPNFCLLLSVKKIPLEQHLPGSPVLQTVTRCGEFLEPSSDFFKFIYVFVLKKSRTTNLATFQSGL